MRDLVHAHGLSLDLPTGIELTRSRNAVADSLIISRLQPYIFRLVCDYVVSGFYMGRNDIEMLPLDYLGLSQYDTTHTDSTTILANKYNQNTPLTGTEILSLQNPTVMIEFLVLIQSIDISGERLSLKDIKAKHKKQTLDMSAAGTIMQSRLDQAREQ